MDRWHKKYFWHNIFVFANLQCQLVRFRSLKKQLYEICSIKSQLYKIQQIKSQNVCLGICVSLSRSLCMSSLLYVYVCLSMYGIHDKHDNMHGMCGIYGMYVLMIELVCIYSVFGLPAHYSYT